jgi:hypothetical protein
MLVTYRANNSGGYWWLTEENWHDLESAGWDVEWDEFLESPARVARKEVESINEAIDEFEKITGQNANDQGCPCCGPPHSFEWEDLEGIHFA